MLVVEDHVELARDIAEGFRDRGIATDLAYDGSAALQKGVVYRYVVIVPEVTCRVCTETGFAWRCAMAGRRRGS